MKLESWPETEPRPRAALLVAALVPALLYCPVALVIAWLAWKGFGTPLTRPGAPGAVFLVGPLLLPAVSLLRRRSPWTFVFAILVVCEFLCASLAFHTHGQITSGLLMLVLWLNALPVAMMLSTAPRTRRIGVSTALLIALLIVPYHGRLGWRWICVHAEAERIVEYVERAARESGKVPADLSRYAFDCPWTARFIDYSRYTRSSRVARGAPGSWSPGPPRPPGWGDRVRLVYSIGTPDTSHWYNPDGTWGYYPD